MSEFQKKVSWVLVAALLIQSGCASIVSKVDYPVTINSNPEGANIRIVTQDGDAVLTGTTPITVTLKAGESYFKGFDYTIMVEKAGYADKEVQIRRGVDAWYIFGNIVIGGLIGWLIVDPITGAMYTLDQEVNIDLTTTSDLGGTPELNVALLKNIPAPMQAHLVQVR